MKRWCVFLCVWVFPLLACVHAHAQDEVVEWRQIGSGLRDIRAILIDPVESSRLYAAARQGVYRSTDGGDRWARVLSAGAGMTVRALCFGGSARSVYAATSQGLYFSSDAGEHWQRIFIGGSSPERSTTAVYVTGETVYLGTGAGLFRSADNGINWERAEQTAGEAIVGICAADHLFFASQRAVYALNARSLRWDELWHASYLPGDDEQQEEVEEDEPSGDSIHCISCSGPQAVIGYGSALLQGSASPGSWEAVDTGALGGEEIRVLLSRNGELIAGTRAGLFISRDGLWQDLSYGSCPGEVQTAASDGDSLYLGCETGLYAGRLSVRQARMSAEGLSASPVPDIRQVQQAAIAYAEVDNAKIDAWRKRAASRAWLPKLSIGVDQNTGDLWHWEGGSTTRTEDDVLRKGKASLEWDVTLSWDLGDLLWNADQTSIDVRSKLMVQLREDILDQVNKLYFERLRLAGELDQLPDAGTGRFEKELKLREIIASLDGLTGGWFSAHIR